MMADNVQNIVCVCVLLPSAWLASLLFFRLEALLLRLLHGVGGTVMNLESRL
jgi:hypothetical protein